MSRKIQLVLGLLGILAALSITMLFSSEMAKSMNFRDQTQVVCLEHGYPDFQVHGNKGYCIRLEGGNQVVINVNDLEPK